MNPIDDAQDRTQDDEQIASVLASSQADAAPPDKEFLAQLRMQSTDAFTAAAASPPVADAPGSPAPAIPRGFFRRSRWLGGIAAAVTVGIGLYYLLAPGVSGVAFGLVLEKLEEAKTLHVRISQNDPGAAQKVELWHTNTPNQSRWDIREGAIVEIGNASWYVNEKANLARRLNPSAKKFRLIDELLQWIRLPAEHASILAALPSAQIRDGGEDVLVYRAEVRTHDEKVWFEARVIAGTNRLASVRTWFANNGKKEPHSELTVLAYDEPIDAEKFVIADTLTQDGRIGTVADVQGIVTIKPVLDERWTPVREGLVLEPGDWVRTDARGANATALHLVKKTGVILGPKTLVELIGPKQIRVIEGEVEITAAAGAPIELLGPGPQKVEVKGRQFYRVTGPRGGLPATAELTRIEKDPPWLLGFKGASANEPLGSLVALVDGRNVPLTVGYHKVTVDIRDQIARTVIEESFVNHTNAELEGVFSFPLPADASISGFGMWIGDNLVEADVVEKQRAREIYETIMSERRDPGLLEWSGGNIFKARVFPIPARSEKRIKISYTQVLPMKGNRYRYSYALQSEMLQQHPLRELNIDVKVHSVQPLRKRVVADASDPRRPDHALGPRRVHGPGIYADA